MNGTTKSQFEVKYFDSAEDLLKIGENPIVLDNEKEDRKVDPSKFLSKDILYVFKEHGLKVSIPKIRKL